jgi:hypothetical protein
LGVGRERREAHVGEEDAKAAVLLEERRGSGPGVLGTEFAGGRNGLRGALRNWLRGVLRAGLCARHGGTGLNGDERCWLLLVCWYWCWY